MDLSAVAHNTRVVRQAVSRPATAVMAVVKAGGPLLAIREFTSIAGFRQHGGTVAEQIPRLGSLLARPPVLPVATAQACRNGSGPAEGPGGKR
ncbi:alanine racemase [Streptomyces sp. RM1]